MNLDLRKIMEEHMGFGDFIFRDPKTHEEVMRVSTLKELQDNIFKIPNDSMLRHISRNHMSRWLCARAIFPVSAFLKDITWHKLQDVEAHKQIIFDAIVKYRHMKNIGTVAVFDRKKFDKYAHFARIGEGLLGGKGRGLAFLDNIIKPIPTSISLRTLRCRFRRRSFCVPTYSMSSWKRTISIPLRLAMRPTRRY